MEETPRLSERVLPNINNICVKRDSCSLSLLGYEKLTETSLRIHIHSMKLIEMILTKDGSDRKISFLVPFPAHSSVQISLEQNCLFSFFFSYSLNREAKMTMFLN